MAYQIDAVPDGETVLYGSCRNVVIRNLKDPSKNRLVGGHVGKVSVARLAPNGNWVASGDDAGKVRTWAYTRLDAHCKNVKSTIGVNDLAWDGESKRIAVGGVSGGNKVAAFAWDTGSDLGKLTNHGKAVNSVDMKPNRPFRVISGSEDYKINMYAGPPFSHDASIKMKNFVNCVRFAPDGSQAVAVTASSEIVVIDGKSGEKVKIISKKGQKGFYTSCAWTSDSKSVAVASSKGHVSVFDVASEKCTSIVRAADDESKPLKINACHSVAFHKNNLIGVTLRGDIVDWGSLPSKTPKQPKTYTGHKSAITCSCVHGKKVYTADSEGAVLVWDNAVASRLGGNNASASDPRLRHRSNIVGIGVCGDLLLTVASDQTLRTSKIGEDGGKCTEEKLGGTPISFAVSGNIAVCATSNDKLIVIENGTITGTTTLKKTASKGAVGISPDGTEVAVGVKRGSVVHRYTLAKGGSAKYMDEIDIEEEKATCIEYSPDGKLIATGDTHGEIKIWKRDDVEEAMIESYWTYHKSRITSMSWGSTSKFLVAGSFDRGISIWLVKSKKARITYRMAHLDSVMAVSVIDDNTFISTGDDCSVQWWSIEDPPKAQEELSSDDEY